MTTLPLLGAHMSTAGGFARAVERAAEVGADCVQVFASPPRQWPRRHSARGAALPDGEADAFRHALDRLGIDAPLVHASYLINLAAPDPTVWRASIDALVIEMQRAAQLSIPAVVVHPGAYTTSSEAAGISRIVKALDRVGRKTGALPVRCLLENTAGQGTCLGCRFEQLAEILTTVQRDDWLGVCLDTCHALAAGYAMSSEAGVRRTLRNLDECVGLERVLAVHLNDSRRPRGSRVDRHAGIGDGHVGLAGFRCLLRYRRLRHVPMYIETPKGTDDQGRDLDAVNLDRLRALARQKNAGPRVTEAR